MKTNDEFTHMNKKALWVYKLIAVAFAVLVGAIIMSWARAMSVGLFSISVSLGVLISIWLGQKMYIRWDESFSWSLRRISIFTAIVSHFITFIIYFELDVLPVVINNGSYQRLLEVLPAGGFFGLFSLAALFWLSIPMYLLVEHTIYYFFPELKKNNIPSGDFESGILDDQ